MLIKFSNHFGREEKRRPFINLILFERVMSVQTVLDRTQTRAEIQRFISCGNAAGADFAGRLDEKREFRHEKVVIAAKQFNGFVDLSSRRKVLILGRRSRKFAYRWKQMEMFGANVNSQTCPE